MLLSRVIAGTIIASTILWPVPAKAGWVIDQVTKGAGEGARQQVVLQANRMKTLMLGADGEPVTTFILDLNAQTITQVDYVKRQYTTTTVQEFGQVMQGAMEAASEHVAKAMEQMKESMKDMPPEQRKMMEEMMRSHMPKSQPTTVDCQEPKVELRKTGQQATIAGYQAVRYDVLIDGKPESELWLAKGIAAWRELDPQKLEKFAAEMAKLAPRCGRGQRQRGFRGDDPAWKLANEGYPVRTVHQSDGRVTVEVVKAETRTVPATEFQPPAGFARKTFPEMMQH
ncbi:MAG: DUF4412 domain-containing protein [candidate division NC10 bacterium]|nr:DUF4412 domain-containing protein [candidate division NC10 bacterium]